MPIQPCNEPGCSNLVTRGRCPTHTRDRVITPLSSPGYHPDPVRLSHPHKAFYASSAWDYARRRYLASHPVCEICNRAPSTEVHHLKSITSAPELKLEESNFQATCHPCHSKETVERDGGFGRAPKGEGKREEG